MFQDYASPRFTPLPNTHTYTLSRYAGPICRQFVGMINVVIMCYHHHHQQQQQQNFIQWLSIYNTFNLHRKWQWHSHTHKYRPGWILEVKAGLYWKITWPPLIHTSALMLWYCSILFYFESVRSIVDKKNNNIFTGLNVFFKAFSLIAFIIKRWRYSFVVW